MTGGGWRLCHARHADGNCAIAPAPIHGDDLPVYRRVDWLIGETPLRDPLLWWADVWGVRGPFVEGMAWRPRRTKL